MAKSGIIEFTDKISQKVISKYNKIENFFVRRYLKIEDKFVDLFLTKDGETVSEAKERLKAQAKS